jgi:hypothetical protein
MKFDAYSLKARIAPAFISIIIPVMVFNHFYTSEEFAKFVGDVLAYKIAANFTISAVLLFFVAEGARFVSKQIFERLYFKQELYMPTTNFLLFSDHTYSPDYKTRMRKKISTEFKLQLSSEAEETSDPTLARTKIVETMALIRKKLHGNKFLLQHNIEYGAIRNLIGGSAIGLLISLSNIIFFKFIFAIRTAVAISIATALVYAFIVLISRILFNFYGANYAKVLFREYCGAK